MTNTHSKPERNLDNIPTKVSAARRFRRKTVLALRIGASCLIFPFTALTNRVLERKKSEVRNRLLNARVGTPTGRAALGSRHPESAILRERDDKLINHIAESSKRYYISIANRDGDVRGAHAYYGPFDYSVAARKDKVLPDDVITAVDADYYMSPKQFSSYSGHDMVFRTFVPAELSAVREEYAYTTLADGRIQYTVKGGSTYEHPLWNYQRDACSIPSYTTMSSLAAAANKGVGPLSCEIMNLFCGLVKRPKIHWMYKIDSRDSGLDHAIVALTPYARVFNPKPKKTKGAQKFVSAMIAPMEYHAGCGERYMMRQVHQGGEMRVQVSTADSYDTINIPASDLQAIRAQARRVGDKQSVANVASIIQASRVERELGYSTQGAIELLYDIATDDRLNSTHTEKVVWGRAHVATHIEEAKDVKMRISETNPGPLDLSDVPNRATAVGPSMTSTPAAVPSGSAASLADGIQRRALDVAANKDPIPGKYYKYRAEFLRMLTKKFRGKLVKHSYEEVVSRFRRKVQRMRAFNIEDEGFMRFLASIFEKAETLGDLSKPARLITGPNPSHNIEYAGYIGPTEDAMKGLAFPWYSPGKTPLETATQVKLYLKALKPDAVIVDTDFSKYDGTKDKFLREMELMLMEALFPEEEHGALKRLYKAEINMKLVSKKLGVTAKTEYQTGSGTRGTTLFNTIQNAFVPYCRNRDVGQNPNTAMNNIGPKYGDDSIEQGPAEGLVEVATALKLRLTTSTNPRGGPIMYLGRLYPDVINYSGSVPDPMRLAKKMHISFMSGDPKPVALAKAIGFLGSDSHVPLFSDYANWIKKRNRHVTAAELDRETQFKLASGDMPEDLPDTTLALIAQHLGTTAEHCEKFIKLCRQDAKPEKLEEFFIQTDIRKDGDEPTLSRRAD